ncbi:Rhomboid-like protein 11 [Citrus sinensis]|uniref:Rhomboid-like protein 11 n=1 Tax=Citrus sinensis TaxID=2711 RepID=A0ACB8NNN0_CITSI|nr:Rhomboid-like protein 11 [Citrus sinensis]KAH9799492.1 Rhomboid-like protein 11 [Citrus sinensis]
MVPICDCSFLSCYLARILRNHLSSNLFFFYTFGKLVEEEEGNCGLWLSYIFSGAAANFVPWLILPKNAVSVGAAGAVFGLFAISVLVKMSWDRRKVLEVLILDELVVEKPKLQPERRALLLVAIQCRVSITLQFYLVLSLVYFWFASQQSSFSMS